MQFPHFEIRAEERKLLVNHQEVVLGSRAFDVLLALAAHPCEVLSKQTLLTLVWPDSVVEENNLQVHISTLRKLLGAHCITTVPGRGYCLTVAPLTTTPNAEAATPSEAAPERPPVPAPPRPQGNLSNHMPRLIARDQDVQALGQLLKRYRMVTVTGSAGVGKTHLVKSIALAQRADWPDGLWWLDLTTVHNTSTLTGLLVKSLRLELTGDGAELDDVAQALQSKRLMLALDNCEHLREATRDVVSALLNQAPDIQILTTSQARLQAVGECVYQLSTLPVPDLNTPLAQALQVGAIALFVERVQQLDRRFQLTGERLPLVIDICQRLDGVPLAIELAAARVPMLGLQGVQERLGERLRLLVSTSDGPSQRPGGRHASLHAALDWTYQLLNEPQARLFQSLSLFLGSFGLASVVQMSCDEEEDEWDLLAQLEQLINYSMVMVEGDGAATRYRLLETQRVYALERLRHSEELPHWQERFSQAMVKLSSQWVKARDTSSLWREMNHLRAAYDWSCEQPDHRHQQDAIVLATNTCMVLAVSGFAQEALARLLKVEPWLGPETAPAVAARYWQWLGRCGVHGRLSTSRCVNAFVRAESLFQALQEGRHVHACRRMRAEALLNNGHLVEAKQALQEARAMETATWPVADRMRRIRVQALLSSQLGQYPTALRSAQQALVLAQAMGIERYVRTLELDIANLHLHMGAQEQALALYRRLTTQHTRSHFNQLTMGQSFAGLMTVLLQRGEVREAAQACLEGLSHWRTSGLVLNQGDMFAWWLLLNEQPLLAVRMLAAANQFFASKEIVRDAVAQGNHHAVQALLSASYSQRQLQVWLNQATDSADLRQLLNELETQLEHRITAPAQRSPAPAADDQSP